MKMAELPLSMLQQTLVELARVLVCMPSVSLRASDTAALLGYQ